MCCISYVQKTTSVAKKENFLFCFDCINQQSQDSDRNLLFIISQKTLEG